MTQDDTRAMGTVGSTKENPSDGPFMFDGSTDTQHPERQQMKRINLNLPATVFHELQILAKRSGRTMTELIRFALGLLSFVFTEINDNRRLAVTDKKGQIIKEIVLPW